MPSRTKARTGVDLTRPQAASYVGREDELAELTRLFETTGGETPVRLVTVIGEAGMGKSRMVAELRAHVDKRAGPVTWRQGRCLPYGEGITFWALGEVVKAQAGILESDSPAEAEAKLTAVVPPGPGPGLDARTAAAPHRPGVDVRQPRRVLRRLAPVPGGHGRRPSGGRRHRGPPLGR